MGFKFMSDASNPPNPDPARFNVLKKWCQGSCTILEVKYEGCTTFGGRKLLLINKRNYKVGDSLDPHLLGNDVVIARFEPNEQGWKLAKKCADYLTDWYPGFPGERSEA